MMVDMHSPSQAQVNIEYITGPDSSNFLHGTTLSPQCKSYIVLQPRFRSSIFDMGILRPQLSIYRRHGVAIQVRLCANINPTKKAHELVESTCLDQSPDSCSCITTGCVRNFFGLCQNISSVSLDQVVKEACSMPFLRGEAVTFQSYLAVQAVISNFGTHYCCE